MKISVCLFALCFAGALAQTRRVFNRPLVVSTYRANNNNDNSGDGQYRPDNSGAYRNDDGRYHPDSSGSYVHQDQKYNHQDSKYQHSKDKFGNDGSNFGGSGGSGGFGPGFSGQGSSGSSGSGNQDSNLGAGSGSKFGSGSGSLSGTGFGSGSNSGLVSGSGSNSGHGVGFGSSSGHGVGSGSRFGSGSGSSGFGSGHLAAGSGSGSGISAAAGFGAPVALQQGSAAGFYDNKNYGIIRKVEKVEEDGYHYLYETENGITGEEQGKLANRGTDDEAMKAHGYYTYTGPDNVVYTVRYTADENGFIPEGAHIPTPPPIPEAILRALEYQRSIGTL